MKTIVPINVWIKGEIKTAELFRLRSTGDDLATRAEFYYELLEEDGLAEPYIPYMVADGNISISGTDYTTWKANADTNEYAYTWAANQLNLVIITPP
jgi:hypothetical protein